MANLAILAEGTEAHAEPTALFLTSGGWVALSMITLIGIMIYLGVPKMVAAMLDKKIEGIRTMLDDAAKLRSEAEALKGEYQTKLAGAEKHAEELKVAAEAEAKNIVEQAKVDAKALVARREKMAEEKIAAAERAAVDDLRAKTAVAATAAARELIAEKHGADADKSLVDEAISGL